MGQSAQFTIPNMDQSSMDKLLELSKKLGELSSKAYKLAGESYGYDGTDPPFRGYSELWDDKAFAEVANPLMHGDFEDNYIQLADLIYERVARLEEAVWKIIRKSVTE